MNRTPALLLVLLLSRCASDEPAVTECPVGSEQVSNGLDVCVIQETGFGVVTRSRVCPPNLPFLHALDGLLVCSA